MKQHCPFVTGVASCTNPKEGPAHIYNLRPDVVFVETGVYKARKPEYAEPVGELNIELILVETNKRGGELKFTNFQPRSIFTADLQTAVAKALQRMTERSALGKLAAFMHNAWSVQNTRKLALSIGSGLEFITIGDVFYGQAEGNYTRLYFAEGQPLFVSHMLKELEIALEPFGFIRIHNSYIANLQKVVRYHRGDGGEIELVTGQKLPVARSRKEGFLAKVQLA